MAAIGRSFFGRFFGSTIGEGAGFAMGVAAAPALAPLVQDLINAAHAAHRVYPIRVMDAAQLVAQGHYTLEHGDEIAAAHGIGPDSFADLVTLALEAPTLSLTLRLWQRGAITEAEVDHALEKAQIEEQYRAPIKTLFLELLPPAVLAQAIHRGLIPDPGLLEGDLPSGEGNVPAYPVYPIDALKEASGGGIDRDRLGVLVGLQGNPMGPHEAALARFRGILNENDYLRAIAEGNTRNEWAQAIFEQTRQIPTARDFLENALRGYRTLSEAIAGAELHGMSPEHATLIYQNQGRPMIPRQITQALAWGATFHPEPGEITDPYEASTVEGNVKPAYYEFYKALRYALPSAFYFRLLQQQNVITEDQAKVWYRRLGWPPELADQVAHAFAGGGTGTADAHVGKAQTHLWTTTHRSYVAGEATVAEVESALGKLGIDAASQTAIVDLWDAERALRREQLTAAQVKKIFQEQTWSRQQALDRLFTMGYSLEDAGLLLDE